MSFFNVLTELCFYDPGVMFTIRKGLNKYQTNKSSPVIIPKFISVNVLCSHEEINLGTTVFDKLDTFIKSIYCF